MQIFLQTVHTKVQGEPLKRPHINKNAKNASIKQGIQQHFVYSQQDSAIQVHQINLCESRLTTV